MTVNYTRSGFTIVELLIVIVVIGILAAISIVAYNGIQARTHATAIKSDLANNAKKLEEYKILNGSYPATRTEFRDANLNFTLGSSRYAVYCVNNSLADPVWAIALRSSALDKNFYRTNTQGTSEVAVHWGTASGVCDTLGVESAGRNTTWLRASGDWGDWVVY